MFDERGKFLYKFGKKGNGDGLLNRQYGLCVDKHDNVFLLPKCSVIGFGHRFQRERSLHSEMNAHF